MKFLNPVTVSCPNLDKSAFEMDKRISEGNCVVSPKLHLAVVPLNVFSFVAPIS